MESSGFCHSSREENIVKSTMPAVSALSWWVIIALSWLKFLCLISRNKDPVLVQYHRESVSNKLQEWNQCASTCWSRVRKSRRFVRTECGLSFCKRSSSNPSIWAHPRVSPPLRTERKADRNTRVRGGHAEKEAAEMWRGQAGRGRGRTECLPSLLFRDTRRTRGDTIRHRDKPAEEWGYKRKWGTERHWKTWSLGGRRLWNFFYAVWWDPCVPSLITAA